MSSFFVVEWLNCYCKE